MATGILVAIIALYVFAASRNRTDVFAAVSSYIVKERSGCYRTEPGRPVRTVHGMFLKGISQKEVDRLLDPQLREQGYVAAFRDLSQSGNNCIGYEKGGNWIHIRDSSTQGFEDGVVIYDYHLATKPEAATAWLSSIGRKPRYEPTDAAVYMDFFKEFQRAPSPRSRRR